MKNVVMILLLSFVVGDCVQLVKGVFKGEYWVIRKDNRDGTFNIRQDQYYLTNVRGSFLRHVDAKQCKQSNKNK